MMQRYLALQQAQSLDEAFDGTNACSPGQFAKLDGLLAG
jgi:hypothetical protein